MGLISRVSSQTYRTFAKKTEMSGSKINRDNLYQCVDEMLAFSRGEGENGKKRAFLESVELQIMLKNYDTQKDKRFSGTVKLPNVARKNFSVCVLGNQAHIDEAVKHGVPHMSVDDLKNSAKTRNLSRNWLRNTMLSWLLML